MKLYTTFFCLFFLMSCAVPRPLSVSPEYVEVLKPGLNALAEAEVGETLIRKETGHKYQGIELIETIKYKPVSSPKPIEFKTGEVFIYTKQSKLFDIYTQPTSVYAIAIDRTTGAAQLVSDTYGIGRYSQLNKLVEASKFQKEQIPVQNSDYLKQEFIYNGKIGTGIKFTYREFSDNLARPAFSQDLQYDLSEGTTVGFKGLRIEVIHAANTKIEYKVTSYFTN